MAFGDFPAGDRFSPVPKGCGPFCLPRRSGPRLRRPCYDLRTAPSGRQNGSQRGSQNLFRGSLEIAAKSTVGASDQRIIVHLTATMTRAMAQDPRQQPARRNSFLPANLPQERWGLLMPAAVALALLLIVAMVVVRLSG